MRRAKQDAVVLCPFTIIVDTREQAPFRFTGIKAGAAKKYLPVQVSIARAALPTGDYSIKGLESYVSIERKSAADFCMCCGRERERFVRELERLNKIPHAHVVIESSLESIASSMPPHSRMNPKSVTHSVASWSIEYPNIHFWDRESRVLAERWTYRLLNFTYEKMQQKGLTNGLQDNGPAGSKAGLAPDPARNLGRYRSAV